MYCENCGTKLDANVKFCTNCGTKQISIEQKKESSVDIIKEDFCKKENITKKNRKKKVVILLAVIVFVSVILIFLGIDKKGKDKTGENGLTNSENTYDNYETSENEDYHEGYSEDKVNENVFVSDWQEGEMNIEGNKSYRIVNESNNFYFTEQGEWVYYIFENCIYKENSLGETILVAQFDFNPKDISVVGDWIYYFYDSCLYRIRTDGQENRVIITEIDSYYIYNNRIFYTYTEQTSADKYSSTIKSCTLELEDVQAFYCFSSLEYDDDTMQWNIIGGYDNKLYYVPAIRVDSHNSYIEDTVIPMGINYIDLDTLEHVEYIGKDHSFLCSDYKNHVYCIMSDYIVAKKTGGAIADVLRFFDLRSEESFTVTPKLDGYFLNYLFDVGYDELNGRFLMSGKTGDKREISLWVTDGIEGVVNNNWLELTSDDATSFINTKNYIYYKTGEDTVYRIDYDGGNWKTVIE